MPLPFRNNREAAEEDFDDVFQPTVPQRTSNNGSLTTPVKTTTHVNDADISSPTEHTVTSVGSDVSYDVSVEASPALVPEKVTTTESNLTKPTTQHDENVPACYLVYEPDSSGRLVEHYSMTPVEGAVGRWVASGKKKIAQFKLKRNAGRNVLIGSCSAGVQGRRNYCNGWCQFVKSCNVLGGYVTLYDVPADLKAMPVDVYLYYDRPDHQSVHLEPGISYSTDKLAAVACLPKSSPFFDNMMTIDIMKWLQDARNYGYSTKI